MNKFEVTTYEEVCKQLNEKQKKLAIDKLKQLAKFFNSEGWKPKFNNSQRNYYPVYYSNGSGSLAFCSVCNDCYDFSAEAVYYESEEIVYHIDKYFRDVYKQLMNEY